MGANRAVDGQPADSVVTPTTSSSQSSNSKRVGTRPTGRGGSGNIRQTLLPSKGEGLEEDKVTSPSGREMRAGRGTQALTGRGGAGNVEPTSKQRLEEARAFLQREKAILAQHKQEMQRHEKRAVGRGGAGNLQRKTHTVAHGFPGAQVGSKLFKTMTRSSHSSSERSVIDIGRTDRDSDLWSIADSTMSQSSTAGIIISRFGESLVGKRRRPTANPSPGVMTGVCFSDASPSSRPPSRQACNYDVTSYYPRTPNEVAPFEEPAEPSFLASAVLNAAASSSRQPQRAESSMSKRPVLKRLIGGWSANEYPPTPRSATSSIFSYPYAYDDTASLNSYQSHHPPARSTSPMMELYRRPSVPTPLSPPLQRVDSTWSSIATGFTPPIPSASAALRMITRSDGDRFSDRTGVRSSGSSFYGEQYSSASTEAESRNGYSASKTSFLRLSGRPHRASTGRYGTPGSYATPSASVVSVATAHTEASVPQFESFTPTFGVKKLPSLPAASLRSFDEFSLPSPPSTPLAGGMYSESAYDSGSISTADPHTRLPQLNF